MLFTGHFKRIGDGLERPLSAGRKALIEKEGGGVPVCVFGRRGLIVVEGT